MGNSMLRLRSNLFPPAGVATVMERLEKSLLYEDEETFNEVIH